MSELLDEQFGSSNEIDADDILRDLLEREHLILEMEATEGWKLWRDYVAALAQPYQNRLLKGRHLELVEMKYDAGLVEGIRIALGASETLAGKIKSMRRLLELGIADMEEEQDGHTGI